MPFKALNQPSISGPRLHFQQDNDVKHTANKIQRYLDNYDTSTMVWPSLSSDLSPIENLWSILDDMIKDRQSTTEEELFQVLETVCKAIVGDLLTHLVDSMPRRIQAVIAANG